MPSARWLIRANLFIAGFCGGLWIQQPNTEAPQATRILLVNIEQKTPVVPVSCERLNRFESVSSTKTPLDRALECDCEFTPQAITAGHNALNLQWARGAGLGVPVASSMATCNGGL